MGSQEQGRQGTMGANETGEESLDRNRTLTKQSTTQAGIQTELCQQHNKKNVKENTIP